MMRMSLSIIRARCRMSSEDIFMISSSSSSASSPQISLLSSAAAAMRVLVSSKKKIFRGRAGWARRGSTCPLMTTSVEVSEVGRWYEARLLESTACCSGELFAVCHLLVSLLHLLKRSAQQLQSLAERGNAKLHKFAEVCGARAVPRTVPRRDADSCPRTAALHHRGRGDGRGFPDLYRRYILEDVFVSAVHSKVLPLDAQASTALKAAPGHVNGRHLLAACCKELRRVLSELPLASLHRAVQRAMGTAHATPGGSQGRGACARRRVSAPAPQSSASLSPAPPGRTGARARRSASRFDSRASEAHRRARCRRGREGGAGAQDAAPLRPLVPTMGEGDKKLPNACYSTQHESRAALLGPPRPAVPPPCDGA